MARFCAKCQQGYPEDLLGCPRCAGRLSSVFGRSRLPALQPLSDARIDLGSPVKCALGGDEPPSGASFISWTVLLARRKKTLDPEPSRPGFLCSSPVRYSAVLLLGFVLGCALCVSLAWIGWLPVQGWGAASPAPPTAASAAGPGEGPALSPSSAP